MSFYGGLDWCPDPCILGIRERLVNPYHPMIFKVKDLVTNMKHLTELNHNPLILSVTFECLYAPEIDINIEMIDDDRVEALLTAWKRAIDHYCPNLSERLNKQLKRKLGSIHHFYDITDTKLSYINESGKREQITIIGAVQLTSNDMTDN